MDQSNVLDLVTTRDPLCPNRIAPAHSQGLTAAGVPGLVPAIYSQEASSSPSQGRLDPAGAFNGAADGSLNAHKHC